MLKTFETNAEATELLEELNLDVVNAPTQVGLEAGKKGFTLEFGEVASKAIKALPADWREKAKVRKEKREKAAEIEGEASLGKFLERVRLSEKVIRSGVSYPTVQKVAVEAFDADDLDTSFEKALELLEL